MPLKQSIQIPLANDARSVQRFALNVAQAVDVRRVAVRVTTGTESVGVRPVTLQVIDRLNRDPISGRWLIRFWISETEWGEPGGAQDVSITTGTLVSNDSDQVIEAATDDGGELVFDLEIASAGNRYVHIANLEELTSSGQVASAGGGSVTSDPAAGGTTVHSGSATVDFGSPHEDATAVVTVTGQAWVTADAIITATAPAIASADHDADDAALEGLTCHVGNIVAGTGFDITVSARDTTWGRFTIQWTGIDP